MYNLSSYEIAIIYQFYRREIGNKYYRVALDDNGLAAFDKTRDKIIEMGVDAEEFIKAQFVYSRPYPFIVQLHSNQAVRNYIKYLREKSKNISAKELFELYESMMEQRVNNILDKTPVDLLLTNSFPPSYQLYTLRRVDLLNKASYDQPHVINNLIKGAYWELKSNTKLFKYYITKGFNFNNILKEYKYLIEDTSFPPIN